MILETATWSERFMPLQVAEEVFSLFPGLVVGVITARGVRNSSGNEAVTAMLRTEEQRVRTLIGLAPISEHPRVAPWRDAYRAFGAKPKDNPSSIENLVRRVTKGGSLPSINTLVDLYNVISLRHLVPAGGEDLDQIRGDIVLTRAGEDEAPVRLLGESEERPPHPGEVIYRDEFGAICRRLNWKEADRTKLTPETRNAVLVIEGVQPISASEVRSAIADLGRLITTHCGGELSAELLTASGREVVPI
jgi:DNA/RNA-binding domain of Phe-tRNA-synthetase-like protein